MNHPCKTRWPLLTAVPLLSLVLGGCGSDSNPLPSNFSPVQEPWELFVLGDNDPASRLVINPSSEAGVYEFRMTEPDHFSWLEVDEEGQSAQPDKALMLFLKAWHMLYGDEWADGRLLTLDAQTGSQFNLALRLSRPLLNEETQEMVFQARLVSQLSDNLKQATPNSGAPLALRMPTGQWTGQTTLWVENATGVPHHRLSEGIKYETRQLPLAYTPKGISLVQDAVAATSSNGVVNTDIENPTWPTGDCKNEYLTNQNFSNWKEFVVAYNQARKDLQAYKLTEEEILAVSRAYMMPCDPVVTDGSPDVPANVALIKSILTQDLWDGLTTQMVVNEMLTAAQRATFTYDNFLKMAGKYPFFCGEPGVYQLNGKSSLEEACRRDLAAFFAHATQETGAHDPNLVPSGTPYWKQAFATTRENGCYLGDICNPVSALCPEQYVSKCPQNPTDDIHDPKYQNCPKPCDQYDPGVNAAGGTCPPDFTCSGHFYGRGFMQLSYYFNYLGFGGQILNDPKQFVSNPDLVAQNGLFSLGSAFWFYMSPQPPKPSMHDVITGGGGYHPTAPSGNVALVKESYIDWQGQTQTGNNPVDKFMMSISVINGGVECSPEQKYPNPTDEEKTLIAQARAQAISRMQYFNSLLTYFGATLTTLEQGYASNTTGCTIDNGSPFSTNLGPTSIGYAPRWWLAADSYDKCGPVSWQAQPPLALASEKSREVCLDICGSTCE